MIEVRDAAHFAQLKADNAILVADFTATWCGPCRRASPLFDAMSKRHAAVMFVKVWEHQCRELIMSENVRAFPTFRIYVNGSMVQEVRGARMADLESKIVAYKESATGKGPFLVKLKYPRTIPRESGVGTIEIFDELEIEIEPAEGLEVLQFQILSLTEIECELQEIQSSSGLEVNSDESLLQALGEKGGLYGNCPVLQLRRRKSPPPYVAPVEAAHQAGFQQRLRCAQETASRHGDVNLQQRALDTIPVSSIRATAAEIRTRRSCSEEEGLARALLRFFKRDFFKWVDIPVCSTCPSKKGQVKAEGATTAPNGDRVELYRCMNCSAVIRFTRYNNPGELLQTRCGRCGEWANCFALICCAMGLSVRYVVDWTDHVWTEVFLPEQNRWAHADPCENSFDRPLMYERGWRKKVSYVMAFNQEGQITDVTRRYTRCWNEVLERRKLVSENWLRQVLAASYPGGRLSPEGCAEEEELKKKSLRTYADEDKIAPPAVEDLSGRQSGSFTWRASRGEAGSCSSSALTEAVRMEEMRVASCIQSTGEIELALEVSTEGIRLSGHLIPVADCDLGLVAVCGLSGTLLRAARFSELAELEEAVLSLPKSAVLAAVGQGHTSLWHGASATPKRWGIVTSAEQQSHRVWHREDDISLGDEKHVIFGKKLFISLRLESPTPAEVVAFEGMMHVATLGQATLSVPSAATDDEITTAIASLELPPCVQGVSYNRSSLNDGNLDLLLLSTLRGGCVSSFIWRTLFWGHGGIGGHTPEARAEDCQVRLKRRFKAVFDDLVKGGMEPTEAAAHSLEACPNALCVTSWQTVVSSEMVGCVHGDSVMFSDIECTTPSVLQAFSQPLSLCIDGGRQRQPAHVAEVIGWGGEHVNGLQIVCMSNGKRFCGPRHFGDHGIFKQSRLILSEGESIQVVEIYADSVVDKVIITTSLGRNHQWGGEGAVGKKYASLRVSDGTTFAGFIGSVGGHLHSIGILSAQDCGGTSLESPQVHSIYCGSPLKKACFLLREASACSSDELGDALKALKKYLTKIVEFPAVSKYRKIRANNAFFQREIGKYVGSGRLMEACGFDIELEVVPPSNAPELFYIMHGDYTPDLQDFEAQTSI